MCGGINQYDTAWFDEQVHDDEGKMKRYAEIRAAFVMICRDFTVRWCLSYHMFIPGVC